MTEHRSRWGGYYIRASMWYCGDEVCDCTQPQIEIAGPNPFGNVGWWDFVRMWEGTFYSQADPEERKEQEAELSAARRLFRVEEERHANSEEIHNFMRYSEKRRLTSDGRVRQNKSS